MAEKEKILLTQEGVERLKQEYDQLVNVERPKNIEELAAARAQGDLSENADYDAARNRQAEIEGRIREIEAMLRNAEVISGSDEDTQIVRPGMTVTLHDLEEDSISTYEIVGTFETNPDEGRISNECPLAKAIIGHSAGEVVTVMVGEPYQVEIMSLSYGN